SRAEAVGMPPALPPCAPRLLSLVPAAFLLLSGALPTCSASQSTRRSTGEPEAASSQRSLQEASGAAPPEAASAPAAPQSQAAGVPRRSVRRVGGQPEGPSQLRDQAIQSLVVHLHAVGHTGRHGRIACFFAAELHEAGESR